MRFVRCNLGNGKKFIAWSPNKEPAAGAPVAAAKPSLKIPITLGEQAEDALREWYTVNGGFPTQDEIEICRQIDVIEKKAFDQFYLLAKPRPVYGTPEFWKDYHARKKAGLVKPSKKETAKKQKSSDPGSAKSSVPA